MATPSRCRPTFGLDQLVESAAHFTLYSFSILFHSPDHFFSVALNSLHPVSNTVRDGSVIAHVRNRITKTRTITDDAINTSNCKLSLLWGPAAEWRK
jgi:hypothetical protein